MPEPTHVKLCVFGSKVKFVNDIADKEDAMNTMYIDVMNGVTYKAIFLGSIYGIAIFEQESSGYMNMHTFTQDDGHWIFESEFSCGWIYDIEKVLTEGKKFLNSKFTNTKHGFK